MTVIIDGFRPVRVTRQSGKRDTFKKVVGRLNGKQCVWWFTGVSESEAMQLAGFVVALHADRQSKGGGDEWTAEDMGFAKRQIERQKRAWAGKVIEATRVLAEHGDAAKTAPARRPSPPTEVMAIAAVTLHQALDAYAAAVQEMPGSRSYRIGIKASIDTLKVYWTDRPLSEVDFAALESMTNAIKARPQSRRKTKATKKHERIAPYTVARLLQHGRQAIKWIHRQRESARFGGWRAPSDWPELFSVELTRIMTKAERDAQADGPMHITVDDIVRLYKAANTDLHRILVLLGVFTAQGQTELV